MSAHLTDATLVELVDELWQALRDSPVSRHSFYCDCHWCGLRRSLDKIDRTNIPSWGK